MIYYVELYTINILVYAVCVCVLYYWVYWSSIVYTVGFLVIYIIYRSQLFSFVMRRAFIKQFIYNCCEINCYISQRLTLTEFSQSDPTSAHLPPQNIQSADKHSEQLELAQFCESSRQVSWSVQAPLLHLHQNTVNKNKHEQWSSCSHI